MAEAQSQDQTYQQYRRAGMAERAGFGERPALLIVDFCLGMTSKDSPLGADMSSAIAATRQLQEVCRAKGFPVVYTTVVYSKGCKDGGAFVKKIPSLRLFEVGNGPWSEIDPAIPPRENEPIVNKRFASAFAGTNLASLLTAEKVDTVIVTGCTTSGCVRASALDALQNGFMVVVPREAVIDRAQGPHEANLFDLNAKYADVIGLDETLDYLKSLAGVKS
jgi:nicotinamidase-related amidase